MRLSGAYKWGSGNETSAGVLGAPNIQNNYDHSNLIQKIERISISI